MPKTAMNEYNFFTSGENKIRFTRQVFSMQAVTITERMDHSSYNHLGLGIPALDTQHAFPALFGCQNISHAFGKV
jgi:hypothetical protein